jgi:formylglycine-generating enzyme required for sulfatase activity
MTQGQWEFLTGRNPSQYGPHNYGQDWSRDGQAWDRLHPAEQVTWTASAALLARIGLGLPTEAQWEHGCRGSTSSVYWSGDDPSTLFDAGNVTDQHARGHGGGEWPFHEAWDDGQTSHAPVGSYRANELGLHDTHGNVWEWCRDVFGTGERFAPGDGERQVSGARYRVLRGGSFVVAASDARSAFRDDLTPEAQITNLGLRPARASRLSASPLHPPGK